TLAAGDAVAVAVQSERVVLAVDLQPAVVVVLQPGAAGRGGRLHLVGEHGRDADVGRAVVAVAAGDPRADRVGLPLLAGYGHFALGRLREVVHVGGGVLGGERPRALQMHPLGDRRDAVG